MSQELGTLIVVVLKARNLIDKHSFYKQDVFAQASLNDIVKKTFVDVKGGQHPVWDSELRFPVLKAVSDKTRNIEVSCFAKEHRNDNLLGKGTVDITETLKVGEFDDWISLEIDGVVRGEVYLEMTYFSSAPAPPASLMDHHGQDLSGRPSKLSPSERLYHPPQSGVSHQNPQAGNHPLKSASQGGHSLPTSYSPSTSGDSALSPLLGKDQSFQIPLPGVLKPGGASRPHQTLCNASKVGPPSVLRPGAGKLPIPQSPNPAHIGPVSPSPGPYRQLPFDERSSRSEFTATNPYLSAPSTVPGTSFIPAVPAVPPVGDTTFPLASYSAPTDVVVFPAWDQVDPATSNPSFPVPMVSTVPQSNVQAELYQATSHQQAALADFSSPIDRNSSSRYQVPLPLPQDVGIDITSSPPHSRPSESRPNMEIHRKAEEDVQEQERRDLELALDLDRQLNS